MMISFTRWNSFHREIIIHSAAFSLYCLLCSALFSVDLFNGKILAPGDGFIFYYPALENWSLWISNQLSGYPAFADPQYLLWYPLRWLTFGYNFLVIAAYVLGSYFTFGLVRRLTGQIMPGILAGLVFGLSGFMTSNLGHPTLIHSAAWLPLVVWAIDGLVTRPSAGWFLIGSIGAACMCLAGFPQLFVYEMLTATAFFLFRLLSSLPLRSSDILNVCGIYTAMITLAAAFAAVQIVPLVELSGLSVRQSWTFEGFVSYSLPLNHIGLLLFPRLLGGDGFIAYFGRRGLDLSVVSCYVSWAALFLMIVPFFASSDRRDTFFWMIIICVAFTFALGDATYVSTIAYHLPMIGQFGVPARALIIVEFAASIVAGFGLAQILSHRMSARQLLWVSGTFSAIATVAVALVFRHYPDYLSRASQAGIVLPATAFKYSAIYIPIFCALVTIVLVPLAAYRGGYLGAAAICAFVFLDLGLFAWHGSGRPGFVTDTDLRLDAQWQAVRNDVLATNGRLVRLGQAIDAAYSPGVPNINLLYGLPHASGYGPLMLKRYADVTGMTTDSGMATVPVSPALYQMLDVAWGMVGTLAGNTLLGAGCGTVGHREPINIQVPASLKVTRIRLVSHLGCSTQLEQDTPVMQIDVNGDAGVLASLSVRAGRETAEWAYDRPDVGKVIRHARPHVLESFDASGVEGHWYDANVEISEAARRVPIRSLTIRGLRDDAVVDLRQMTLIDDASGRGFIPPLAVLSVLQPPNWDEMVAMPRGGYLARFRKSLGLAWLVDAVQRADPQMIIPAIHDGRMPDGTKFDPARLALVEETPPDLGPKPQAGHDGRVDIVSLKPRRWVMDVDAPTASFLVISQTNYPGWRVRVNDAPAHLYQTNYAFQGVTVPAGHSRVVLEFWPASLIIGGGISLCAIVFAVALLVWSWQHRRSATDMI